MSEKNNDVTASPGTLDTSTRYTGRCKWFNNKAGYGFLTVCLPEGASLAVGDDVFVHHSGITVGSEQYKYLVQGEYVDFNLRSSDSGSHPFQASELTGVAGGKLMCETRWEARQAAAKQQDDGDGEAQTQSRAPRRRGGNWSGDRQPRVRLRGTGPRDGETWTLTMDGEGGDGRQNRRHNRRSRPKQDA